MNELQKAIALTKVNEVMEYHLCDFVECEENYFVFKHMFEDDEIDNLFWYNALCEKLEDKFDLEMNHFILTTYAYEAKNRKNDDKKESYIYILPAITNKGEIIIRSLSFE